MTDKAILNELIGEYGRRRADAQNRAEQKREAFLSEHPDYRALCERMAEYPAKLFAALAKANASFDAEVLKREHAALKEQEREYLKKAGVEPSAFEPRYQCETCSDTGYVGAQMCVCLKTEYNRARALKSGLGTLFDKQGFDSFDLERIEDKKDRDAMAEILSDLRAYAEGFTPESAGNLLFFGGTGVGKTHLSSAIGKTVLERGYEVLYDGAGNIVSRIEKERFQKKTDEQEISDTDRYRKCELLIVDDLGTELSSRNTANMLFQLVNSRLVAHKPMIFSTSLKPKELEARYGERLVSRLLGEFETYVFCGRDQRQNGYTLLPFAIATR